MAEALETVAERIVAENRATKSVGDVQEGGAHSTYADFRAPHGVEWSKTSDFGGWEPIAFRYMGDKDDYEDDTYRVWFQQ